MSKLIVVANWKMNPQMESEALNLFEKTLAAAKSAQNVSVIVAPPYPFLESISKRWGLYEAEKRQEAALHLAAQDVFWERDGAYTGEVSPSMEKNMGVAYVIVGHSERRRHLGETNQMINQKLKKALEFGIKPILCVGEESRAGDEIPESVGNQLRAALDDVSAESAESVVVAYEPVWAISGGASSHPDTPSDMHKAALYIKKILLDMYGRKSADKITVLYGGSVDSRNAVSFIAETGGEVHGLLVGRDSLTPDFARVIQLLDRYARQ
ncbi:MAG: triose-phosphate isomerase [Candidatus Sungbacteria bacterium]|nr:triose-phosphate isomerase [Candidatus Sungbacteria bacterium]